MCQCSNILFVTDNWKSGKFVSSLILKIIQIFADKAGAFPRVAPFVPLRAGALPAQPVLPQRQWQSKKSFITFPFGFIAAAKSLENADPETEAGYAALKRFVEVYGTHYIYR